MVLFLIFSARALRRPSDEQVQPLSVGDRRYGVESGILCGNPSKRGPVKLAVTTRDSRDQPVPNDAYRWHWDARVLSLRQREPHVLEHEGQHKSCRIVLPGDL